MELRSNTTPLSSLLVLLFVITAGALGPSACGTPADGGSTTQSSVVATTEAAAGHWEDGGISLDWPAGWTPVSGEDMRWPLGRFLDCTLLFGLDQPSYPRVELIRLESSPDKTLKSAFDESYSLLAAEWGDSMRDVSGWTAAVDGLPALVKSYKLPSGEPYYEHQDVWIDSGGTLYVLAARDGVWTFDEKVLPDLDAITRSLRFGATE